jgi:hypothetical protein
MDVQQQQLISKSSTLSIQNSAAAKIVNIGGLPQVGNTSNPKEMAR